MGMVSSYYQAGSDDAGLLQRDLKYAKIYLGGIKSPQAVWTRMKPANVAAEIYFSWTRQSFQSVVQSHLDD